MEALACEIMDRLLQLCHRDVYKCLPPRFLEQCIRGVRVSREKLIHRYKDFVAIRFHCLV